MNYVIRRQVNGGAPDQFEYYDAWEEKWSRRIECCWNNPYAISHLAMRVGGEVVEVNNGSPSHP